MNETVFTGQTDLFEDAAKAKLRLLPPSETGPCRDLKRLALECDILSSLPETRPSISRNW